MISKYPSRMHARTASKVKEGDARARGNEKLEGYQKSAARARACEMTNDAGLWKEMINTVTIIRARRTIPTAQKTGKTTRAR